MLKFNTARADVDSIATIIDRADRIGIIDSRYPRLTCLMDLSALKCTMDWAALATARDSDLVHDIVGIANHLDRETGKLRGHFLPRFAVQGSAEITISRLEHDRHEGDWHDKPLRWEVRGPAHERQLFSTKKEALLYRRIRRDAPDFATACNTFVRTN